MGIDGVQLLSQLHQTRVGNLRTVKGDFFLQSFARAATFYQRGRSAAKHRQSYPETTSA